MPDRQRHVEIGLVVAVVIVAILLLIDEDRRRSILEHAGAGLGALLGSVAPDILEPPTTPNHRKFFHSGVALVGTGAVALDPADKLLRWRETIRSAAQSAQRHRESLPEGDSRRTTLWLQECAYHLTAGASIGFPIGYGAHLVADSETSYGLPAVSDIL